MKDSIIIDKMFAEDWDSVSSIYEEGILTGNATFQETVPSWEEWDENHLKGLRFVARVNGKVLGWTALSAISSRCVYKGVAEVSVYISKDARGMGIGSRLLERLIEQSEEKGYWTLQSGIFPENEASLQLHKKYGFIVVGKREKIGKLNGVWRDVLLLERRSTKWI
ncbi:N-acetyltransferase family protein [Bacillus sp. AGMB 02131]|uniref:N-acetyltransferase family protein n=1 Tax=Peribacillus faecalis TaxID=2772559 RepID=A0A927CWW8_9BACI|nr:GNAT family N-acetyltransferase [Peribacillus faecalis]MBD3109248.1 N-acetyltransferase family protein [Peribacillus faecalis]